MQRPMQHNAELLAYVVQILNSLNAKGEGMICCSAEIPVLWQCVTVGSIAYDDSSESFIYFPHTIEE